MSNSISHHKQEIRRTAHYSTYGQLSKETKFIWLALHGYGQLARQTIRKFSVLDDKEHFVIAPEGLNRFYWHTNNEPVACWMTREDRYDEISDFVGYLDIIYNRYCKHVNEQKVTIILFGFSQGCATLWRWVHASQPRYDVLVNWAGWIPEDISYLHLQAYFENKRHFLYYGDSDKYLTEEALIGIKEVIQINNLDIEIKQFEGEHKIPKQELSNFVRDHLES